MTGPGGQDDASASSLLPQEPPDSQRHGHPMPPSQLPAASPSSMPRRNHRVAAATQNRPRPGSPSQACLHDQDVSPQISVPHDSPRQHVRQSVPLTTLEAAMQQCNTPESAGQPPAQQPWPHIVLLPPEPAPHEAAHTVPSPGQYASQQEDTLISAEALEAVLQQLAPDSPAEDAMLEPFRHWNRNAQPARPATISQTGAEETGTQSGRSQNSGAMSQRGSRSARHAVFADMDSPTRQPAAAPVEQPAGSASPPGLSTPKQSITSRLSSAASGILRGLTRQRSRTSTRKVLFGAGDDDDPGDPTKAKSEAGTGHPDDRSTVSDKPSLLRTASSSLLRGLNRISSFNTGPPKDRSRSEPGREPEGHPTARTETSGGASKSRRQPILSNTLLGNIGITLSNTLLGKASSDKLHAAAEDGHPAAHSSTANRRASWMQMLTAGENSQSGHLSGAVTGLSAVSGVSKGRRASMIHVLGNLVTGVKTEDLEDPGDPVFTSLDQFRPIDFMYKHTKYMRVYFACSRKTGMHYILKKYPKDGLEMSVERRIRAAVSLAEEIAHPNLIAVAGNWETDEALYVVEEYASHGDLMSDNLSYPDKYTEKYLALEVIKPLLSVLVYLHSKSILHRALYPENIYLARDGKPRLGCYTAMANLAQEEVVDRCNFLDYMAPEMLSMKDESERAEFSQRSAQSTRSARKARRQQARAASNAMYARQATSGLGDDRSTNMTLGTSVFAETPGRSTGAGTAASTRAQWRAPQGIAEGTEDCSVREDEDQSVGHGARVALANMAPDSRISSFNSNHPADEPPQPTAQGFLSAIANTFKRKTTVNWSENDTSMHVARKSGSFTTRSKSFLSLKSSQMEVTVPNNPWEWQTTYDEKVDTWQIGCLVHELMCGCLPFEADDKMLAAALILWADVVVFPDNLSPECVSFIQACLTKDPKQRPSAEQLLRHEWITRQEAGETLLSQAQLQAGQVGVRAGSILASWDAYGGVLAATARGLRSFGALMSRAMTSRASTQAASLPGNATSRPRDAYIKGNLQVAMGRKVTSCDE